MLEAVSKIVDHAPRIITPKWLNENQPEKRDARKNRVKNPPLKAHFLKRWPEWRFWPCWSSPSVF